MRDRAFLSERVILSLSGSSSRSVRSCSMASVIPKKLEIRQIEVASEAGCQKKLCRDSAQIVTLRTRDIECGHNSGCDVRA